MRVELGVKKKKFFGIRQKWLQMEFFFFFCLIPLSFVEKIIECCKSAAKDLKGVFTSNETSFNS